MYQMLKQKLASDKMLVEIKEKSGKETALLVDKELDGINTSQKEDFGARKTACILNIGLLT